MMSEIFIKIGNRSALKDLHHEVGVDHYRSYRSYRSYR